MTTQQAIPLPMSCMLAHLEIDVAQSLRKLPKEMADGIRTCLGCGLFYRCDFDVESRYFQCPNRDLLDQLEDLSS